MNEAFIREELISDNQQRASVFSGAAYYLDENGTSRPVDNNIYLNDMAEPGLFKYITKGNEFSVGFKASVCEEDFVTVLNKRGQKGKITYTLTGLFLYEEDTGRKYLIAAPQAGIPIIDGNAITYPDVFPGTALTFCITGDKVKENIILDESFLLNLTDPSKIGFNPYATKVVFGVKISSYGEMEQEDSGNILFNEADGNSYMFIEAITAKSAYPCKDKRINKNIEVFQGFYADTNEFLYGTTYRTSQVAVYPLEIDPSISLNSSRGITIDDWGGIDGGLNSTVLKAGGEGYTYDDCGSTAYGTEYRNILLKFDLASYVNATVYEDGTTPARLSMYLQTLAVYTTLSLFDHENWAETAPVAFSPIVPALAPISNSSTGWQTINYSIKNLLIKRKRQAAKNICFAIDSTNAGSNWPAQYAVFSNIVPNLPKIQFLYYTALNQNTPTSKAVGKVNVSWVNPGGLVSGDYHRIYYKKGTGLTADQIISGGQYVSSAGYNATTADVPGLEGSQNYCFVVVDTQVVSGVSYEGARSNVMEIKVLGYSDETITYHTLQQMILSDSILVPLRPVIEMLEESLAETIQQIIKPDQSVDDSDEPTESFKGIIQKMVYRGEEMDRTHTKYAYEQNLVRADFNGKKAPDDPLTGITLTATWNGEDLTEDIVGTHVLSDDWCDLVIMGGQPGKKYRIQCKGITEAGMKPEIVIDVNVIEDR